eukprot:TRINITY_DN16815_c0_g1_i1.p1 TRINITY_DN16815_c0_g1~~TRINITY_DN16815_c0_g1_i1.p1  ORF type:complete len:309 (-),score=52.85 TRINITY_DN16815_c0_g1_i1:282-1163(-)
MPIPSHDLESQPHYRWPDTSGFASSDTREVQVSTLVRALWNAREDGDFTFQVQGDVVRAHRCVLSATSPVFKAMLGSDMVEDHTSSMMIEAESSDLLAMLRFCYTGELDATPQQLPGVLSLAHKYEVLNLIPMCCESMIKSLSPETAVSYIRVLRLLEGTPMDLVAVQMHSHICVSTPLLPLNCQAEPSSGGSLTPGGMTSSSSTNTAYPQTGAGLFGGPGVSQPVQPVEVALTTQSSSESVATPQMPVQMPQTRPGPAPVKEKASAIAQAFVAIAKKIAGNPELLMVTLRGL